MAGYGSLTRDEEVGQRPPRNVPLRTVLPLLAVSVLAIAAVCLAVSSSQASDHPTELLQGNFKQGALYRQMARTTSLADEEAAAEGDSEEGADEEEGEPTAPEVSRMHRARREVQEDRLMNSRVKDEDSQVPGVDPPDHWFYSGPATARRIPETNIRAKSSLQSRVGSMRPTFSGAGIATNNALYQGPQPPREHDVMTEVETGAIYQPSRNDVARALEHVESKEIQTEYFHDTMVDNNRDSSHYQQHIHVPHVPNSANKRNGLLSWNGIGGIFGPGAMLGSAESRDDVQLRAKPLPGGGHEWHGDHVLDTERLLKAGSSWVYDTPRSDGTKHDQAQAVLRKAVPEEKPMQFLSYDPTHPPAKPDPTLYVHSWAAYTAEGSRRREAAAKGQEAYMEWKKEHPMQAKYAEHGVPCFAGKVPCHPPPSAGPEQQPGYYD